MDSLVIMNPPTISAKRRWAALVAVLFGQLVVSMDLTILNVALPAITAELRPTSDQQLWMVDAYALAIAGLLVTASSLSDRFGRKKMLMCGFALFGGASAFALVAGTPIALIALRAVLGVAGAMIMPTTISMIRSVFENPKERAFALAAWSVIAGLGIAIGPLLGGVLVEHFSWHAAFTVNVPLMALAIVMCAFVLPEIRVKNPGSWDVFAAALSLVGMTLLMWGIKHAAAVMAVDLAGALSIAAGAILMIAFVRRCSRSNNPLVDIALFKSKPFTAGILAALGSMFAMDALLLLVTQWNQLVDGCGPLESGFRMLPMALASIVAGFAAPVAAERLGARTVVAGGLVISAIGMVGVIAFYGNLTAPVVVTMSALAGIGAGSLSIASSMIAFETPVEKASSAASLEEISYDLGTVLGVAILGSISSVVYRLGLDTSALSAAGLSPDQIAAANDSYSAAVDIAVQTGVTELVAEGSVAFSHSVVIASAIGGVIMFAVAIIVLKLVPKGLDIMHGGHEE